MFCKIFGSNDDQLLVKLDNDANGDVELRFYFQPKSLGVCSLAISFPETEDTWDRAEQTLQQMTEEEARKILKSRIEEYLRSEDHPFTDYFNRH